MQLDCILLCVGPNILLCEKVCHMAVHCKTVTNWLHGCKSFHKIQSRYFEAWHLKAMHKAAEFAVKFAALAVLFTSQVLLQWYKTIIVVCGYVFEETSPLLRSLKVTVN